MHTHSLHTNMDMSPHTPTVTTEPVLPCPHPLETAGGCEKHFCVWTLFLSLQLCSATPWFCHIFTLLVILKEITDSVFQSSPQNHYSDVSLCPTFFLWLNCFYKGSSACRIWCFWLLIQAIYDYYLLLIVSLIQTFALKKEHSILYHLNILLILFGKYQIATVSFIIDHKIECISDKGDSTFSNITVVEGMMKIQYIFIESHISVRI